MLRNAKIAISIVFFAYLEMLDDEKYSKFSNFTKILKEKITLIQNVKNPQENVKDDSSGMSRQLNN